MLKLVIDAEANGFLDTVTNVWCIVAKELNSGQVWRFDPTQIRQAFELLDQADTIIGHNIIGYDLPLFWKLHRWKPSDSVRIIDTWILSQLLYPDKAKHPKTSPKKGPHSIENYGNIFGRPKPEHEEVVWVVVHGKDQCSEPYHLIRLPCVRHETQLLSVE